MFANHKDVSNILRVGTKRETISIQTVLRNKRIPMIKGFKPRTKRALIKETHFVAKHKSMILIMFFFYVNNIQAVLETMNFYEYQRPTTQDRAMNYQKTRCLERSTNALAQ